MEVFKVVAAFVGVLNLIMAVFTSMVAVNGENNTKVATAAFVMTVVTVAIALVLFSYTL